ncbi:phosphoribosylformylglycinamidine synthase [Hathewaya histolytica]|uniref:Phosphoribosylformylglycinamidine synthase n=1 Tax=Hathewaya histolytica TaxID=1498 RepID=A0A4U9RL89_HATHI|nr:phosphoribosylformylglycinamidine synthase [Hathewaya histolytica]VTQ92111.1 phosphoribosylformylglycinamidine synthase [Hathewaya histolytica]
MHPNIHRAFVEKKLNFNVEAQNLLKDLKENLCIKGLENLRLVNRYDIFGIENEEFEKVIKYILSEPNVDDVFEENINDKGDRLFAVEYLEGQYDQRKDAAEQCIRLILEGKECIVKNAKVIILYGSISDEEFQKIKNYYINKVDSKEASIEKPESLKVNLNIKNEVQSLLGFTELNEEGLRDFIEKQSLAMNFEDIKLVQDHFRKEKRIPTITEIKVIDTYWSDHCRHTTFNTIIENVEFEGGKYTEPVKETYEEYLKIRKQVYKNKYKEKSLMDMAVIGMKNLRKLGKLDDLDESDEINACSIVIPVDINGNEEKWLLMFKNETHNHPTEIEPFGGASTCLGGAIRDPLSGRSYVYQAMRVTGSADPRMPIEDTLKGKLPQSKITKEAARGYSSYGNQIGLATGQVTELYHEDFMAKRMEVGAVIGAAPYTNVRRENPSPGDVVILLGGRTGRDGCGGASGSSKEHDEKSILNCGAEVQKGNAPTERKIQRLFRNPKVVSMIKKCNDFGAGGVSVAIGELADGLIIDLDKVPKKYEGLDGTELAISESQERMAVVIEKENIDKFINYAEKENLEATVVAEVTEEKKVIMKWKDKIILNLDRDFLDTNGAKQYINIKVASPSEDDYFKQRSENYKDKNLAERFLKNLQDLNICSQKGLTEMFDSTVGAGTVFMPFGGKYQLTPNEVMACKIPVLEGETNTASLMSYGYNPKIGKWSPFHGAMYSVVESITKIVAAGGDYSKIRLSFQEYFEKLYDNPEKWGKPFTALLGALHVQNKLGIPAIGGKDSMSGTFKDINVPPTLVSFAVTHAKTYNLITPEFKKANNHVVLFKAVRGADGVTHFDILKNNFNVVHKLISERKIISASSVKYGGIAESIAKMTFGNKIGFKFKTEFNKENIFSSDYGSILAEFNGDISILDKYKGISYEIIGKTLKKEEIVLDCENKISIDKAIDVWSNPLEGIFKTEYHSEQSEIFKFSIEEPKFIGKAYNKKSNLLIKDVKPKVLIPVFPGTNCEYDCMKAFEKAGGDAEIFIFNNMNNYKIKESIDEMASRIKESQIIMIPGGFSAGDEPDGSGKFISAVFRNEKIKDSVRELLNVRDGLILGICNGFQALIKLGLLPYGDIVDIKEDSPTLTFNAIGRHISCITNTKIVSTKSPWFNLVHEGDIHNVPVSHGEGRFYATEDVTKELFSKGQVATQYVDLSGKPTYDVRYNPNGSLMAIEGITSPDGRILGKMGHSERIGNELYKNVPGEYDQKIFKSGIEYFK